MSARPIVWSIAGSDSGGGAGIQADLKALAAFEVHGCTAIAALTAQNSVAVERIEAVAPAMLEAQLAALASDLLPQVVKTGLLASLENVAIVARWIDRLRERGPVALVVDPVMVASSGDLLLKRDAVESYRKHLLPLATLVTPNLNELEVLADRKVRNLREMEAAGRELARAFQTAFLLKGGHLRGREAVATFFLKVWQPDARVVEQWFNGQPGVLIYQGETLRAALCITPGPAGIERIYAVRNPEKLGRFSPSPLQHEWQTTYHSISTTDLHQGRI